MNILDIGGGFPGQKNVQTNITFEKVSLNQYKLIVCVYWIRKNLYYEGIKMNDKSKCWNSFIVEL